MTARPARRLLFLLAIYFLLHLLGRTILADGIELDDAEQFLWAQDFRLGYGGELPLYTWLQAALFALFGKNLFAAALLKNFLLFCAYLFTFLAAREASGNDRCGAAAAMTLLFIPQVVWECQRVLTHMILATALIVMSLFFFFRLGRTGALRHYLLFGAATGLGMLSKYNFGIFFFSLVIAAMTLPAFRPYLWGKKGAAALAVFLLIVVVPFSWVALHPDVAMMKSYKLHSGGSGCMAGLRNLAKAAFCFGIVPPLIYGLIFLRSKTVRQRDQWSSGCARLIGRTMVVALAICLILVLFCGVTQFRVRWIQPLLTPLPILLALLAKTRMDGRAFRTMAVIAASVAVFVLLLMNGRILFAAHFKPTSPNKPYRALAGRINENGFSRGVIAAEGRYLGGNLMSHFPSCPTVAPDSPLTDLSGPTCAGPVLAVWHENGTGGMPSDLRQFIHEKFPHHRAPAEVTFVEAPMRWAPDQALRLGMAILKP